MKAPGAEAYRTAMAVTSMALYRTGDAYPICPRCGVTLDREYQNFCDRCGQRLSWRGFRHAQVISK